MKNNPLPQDKIKPDDHAEKTKKEYALKQNPNPAANANIPEDQDKEPKQTEGTGSEITDGEDG